MNVRRDPAASARVRSVNDGDETVPTGFMDDEHRTNPGPRWVRGLTSDQVPGSPRS